jgi:hypothetical protein
VALAAALGLAAAAPRARADGLSLSLEPGYTMTSQEIRDQQGTTSRQEYGSFGQTYHLAFDRQLGSALSAGVGAQLKDSATLRGSGEGGNTESTERNASARLSLSLPTLTGGLSYDLADRRSTGALQLISDEVAGFLAWRPYQIPDLSLRLTRSHHYDELRETQDLTTTGATLSARYHDGPLEAKYLLGWSQPSDAITGTESRSLDQVLQVTGSEQLFEDRTVLHGSLTLRNQVTTTLTPGQGSIAQQQSPVGGLSLIESFPVLPSNGTLVLNPALIDGSVVASAALDIGYGPSVAGDRAVRDAGVQFADLLTPVNQLRVWVDKRLPPELSASYGWAAWQSDDNRTWQAVPITGVVTFDPFQTMFLVPIRETRGRYLKVTTQPLPAGLSTDPAFASVQVTELQAFLVTPAAALAREQASSGALVNLTATTQLWRRIHLAWDFAASLERRFSPDASLWSVLNGLVGSQELLTGLQLSERLARQDGDFGIGHLGQTDWSAGLLWRPVPAFTGSLVYTGQLVDARPVLDLVLGRYVVRPGGNTNTLGSLLRADLYEGISAQLNASVGLVHQPDGRTDRSGTFNASTTLAPNPWISFSAAWLSNFGAVTSLDATTVLSSASRLDLGATFRPTPAISATGSVSRRMDGTGPATSGSAQVSYAPLRGDLQASLAYSDTFDTASQVTASLFSPSLRWNVRPGVQLTASYTLLDTNAPSSETRTRTLAVILNINL